MEELVEVGVAASEGVAAAKVAQASNDAMKHRRWNIVIVVVLSGV